MISHRRAALALLTPYAVVVGVCAYGACATLATSGSVVRERCTHVGLRAHGDAIGEWVGTIQISTDAPVCREVYPAP